MHALKFFDPIDYLLIGHVTADLQPDGSTLLGGTATFSALTAHALGHKVGILTACNPSTDLAALEAVQIYTQPATNTTTFRNISTADGRIQYMYNRAPSINAEQLPHAWKAAPLVHLGPVAGELDPEIFRFFPNSFLCLTLQGWLRAFADDGKVQPVAWLHDHALLKASHAAVLSLEDVRGDEDAIEELAAMCRVLVVTKNRLGCSVYWNRDIRDFPAPSVELVEDTGAGDIFATAFFSHLLLTQDPWEAARFAVILAANSVTRKRLESIPTQAEIAAAKMEIL